MSAAADLDALIADFGNYGDLITTGDSIDRLQRVIQAFSDGTLQPTGLGKFQHIPGLLRRGAELIEKFSQAPLNGPV